MRKKYPVSIRVLKLEQYHTTIVYLSNVHGKKFIFEASRRLKNSILQECKMFRFIQRRLLTLQYIALICGFHA